MELLVWWLKYMIFIKHKVETGMKLHDFKSTKFFDLLFLV